MFLRPKLNVGLVGKFVTEITTHTDFITAKLYLYLRII